MDLRRICFLLLVFSAVLLSGCSSEGARSQAIDTIWSRGLSVGTANLREPATLAVDDQGEKIHLIWAQKGDYGTDIHYALVDRESGIEISEDLHSGLFLPRSYRLFVTHQGQIHLLTHAKSNKDGISGVYHVQISQSGEMIGKPELITPSDQIVESYDAVMLPDGQVPLIWESSRETGGGINYRSVDLNNGASGDILNINATGRGPSLVLEDTGVLHMTWFQVDGLRGIRDIYYTRFPDAEVVESDGVVLTSHGHSESARYSQPVPGYDDGHVYVFWDSEIVGGLEAGTGKIIYVSFPKGQPEQIYKDDILIPDLAVEVTADDSNQLAYAGVSADMAAASSSYVVYPAPISSSAAELPLLMSARTTYRMQEAMQPVMAVLVDGVQAGFAPVARTDYLSYFPVGVRDAQESAYSVWLDFRGGGRYPVYLSSTNPEWKAGILQTKAGDVAVDVSRELAFGLLAIVVLIPMILLVFLIPLSWIIILLLLGRARNLNTRGGKIQLGVGIIIFYITKTAAFANLLSAPSLLRTMPQPWAGIMMIALPALIFAIAAIPLALYVRKADPPGLPSGFFLFVITDLLLTVLVYGPTLYT